MICLIYFKMFRWDFMNSSRHVLKFTLWLAFVDGCLRPWMWGTSMKDDVLSNPNSTSSWSNRNELERVSNIGRGKTALLTSSPYKGLNVYLKIRAVRCVTVGCDVSKYCERSQTDVRLFNILNLFSTNQNQTPTLFANNTEYCLHKS